MQLRQAQQMAAAVGRKKADAVAKLKRLTDKQVQTCWVYSLVVRIRYSLLFAIRCMLMLPSRIGMSHAYPGPVSTGGRLFEYVSDIAQGRVTTSMCNLKIIKLR